MALTQTLAQTVQKATLAGCKAIALDPIDLRGTQTVDGVRVGAGERCIVAGQTDRRENGLYIVRAGAWARTADMVDLVPGALVSVTDGENYNGSLWSIHFEGKARVGASEFHFARMDRDGGTYRFELDDRRAGDAATEDRLAKLEGIVSGLEAALAGMIEAKEKIDNAKPEDPVTAFVMSQMQDGDTFEVRHDELLRELEILINDGRKNPLSPTREARKAELTSGLGRA